MSLPGNGLWEVRYDPYDISRVWIRNHHDGGFLAATWTHLRTAPAPFGELAWTHAREMLAARGADPVTEAEIAAAAADLLDRAGKGPEPQARRTGTASGTRRRAARTRRAHGGSGDGRRPPLPRSGPARTGTGVTGKRQTPTVAGRAAGRAGNRDAPAQVIPLPFFDARKEAEKWW